MSKSIIFDIKKCNNFTTMNVKPDDRSNKMCKTEEDILEFVNDLVVQLWIINTKLDLRFTDEKSK